MIITLLKKGGNTGFLHFLPFLTMFPEGLIVGLLKVDKNDILYHIIPTTYPHNPDILMTEKGGF